MLLTRTPEEFARLRRQRIELAYQQLNPMQRQAVMTTTGPLLLLAGAGSGKTTVLINRIANLIRFGEGADSEEVPDYINDEDCALLERYCKAPSQDIEPQVDRICALRPAAPWSILAITFTNKAARELKERLERAIGVQANDVWAATFHSACVRILRREIERLGFSSSFTIYDVADCERVMKELLREQSLDDKMFPPKAVLGVISRAKDAMQTPADMARGAEADYRMSRIAKLYERYQARLRAANALDFDDIIMHTVTILRDFPEARAYYQNKFHYVLVDEYQDTNHAQYLLSSLLAGGRQNICVVGDDDQSIYRFRGATIENILEFEEQYPAAKVIRLEQNYRSTASILNVANAVIAKNLGRKSKKLWTENESGELPDVCATANETMEADFIVEKMMEGYRKGRRWRDFAVLYRTNAQSNRIEQTLARNGVPYRVIGGHRFFDYAEIKDMLAYLWVLHNPNDTLRLKRIINTPARKIGAKVIETVEEISLEEGLPFYEVLLRAAKYQALSRSASAIEKFTDMMERLRAMVGTMPLSELYDHLVRETGYVDALLAKEDERNQTRIENIQELKSTIMEYEKNADEPSLGGFLDEVALFTDIEQYDAEADCAVLMTIHSAKGLEFPVVFLCGVEDGLFPSYRSIGQDQEIEEERRLFYVAVTRARERLYITHAASRTLFGQTTYNRPSRFLAEIPPECVKNEMESALSRAEADRKVPPRTPFIPKKNAYAAAPHAPKPAAKLEAFSAGDQLSHKTFGDGVVVSARPMGGDVLLEIRFDRVGTKRLMQKTAGQYLTRK